MREFRQLSIDTIHESAANPRRVFSAQSLEELAASIRRRGVLQPILVRPHDDGFTLIAGARRLRASKLAGCPTIPARVLPPSREHLAAGGRGKLSAPSRFGPHDR